MRRKLLLLAAITFTFLFAAGSLYTVRDRAGQRVSTTFRQQTQQQQQQHQQQTQQQQQHQQQIQQQQNHSDENHEPSPPYPTPSAQAVDRLTEGTPSGTTKPPDGRVLSAAQISVYLDEIFGRKETDLPNLTCPAPSDSRYEALKVKPAGRKADDPSDPAVRYFFAIDLRQSLAILPRLIGSIVQAARFLGPESCALSIVQGNSDDGTSDVLEALGPDLRSLGIRYTFRPSAIDPSKGDRIAKLASLRNLALAPLVGPSPSSRPADEDEAANKDADEHDVANQDEDKHKHEAHPDPDPLAHTDSDPDPDPDSDTPRLPADDNTTILFLNDVAPCPDDILELLLQKTLLGAHMTCAMDWTYVGRDPTFYDVWVARGINGDSFFDVPPDGSWDSAWNLFWNAPASRARLLAHQPLQVFACWNGAAAFTARPLLDPDPRRRIAFRAPDTPRGECHQGEPQLFCKDMWHRGYGRIAVVPAVNLEYSVDRARDIKLLKGYTAENVRGSEGAAPRDPRIEWLPPPEEVKCMPVWENQFWRPWNETLS